MTFLFLTASGRKGWEGVTAMLLKKLKKGKVSLSILLVQNVQKCEKRLKIQRNHTSYIPRTSLVHQFHDRNEWFHKKNDIT